MNTKTLFFVGLILCATGVISPPLALLLGLAYGFSFLHPYHVDSQNLSRFLLLQGVILWIVVAASSLWLIFARLISL